MINYINLLVEEVKSSKFAKDAVLLFLYSLAGRVLLFFSNIYAAKCLGPVNLGVSAQILAAVQQAALAFNGGFDTVVVRSISEDESNTKKLFLTITLFRIVVAILLALVWIILTLSFVKEYNLKIAWLMGAFLLVMASLNISFLYQALQRLPIQAAFGTFAAAISALAYFTFFYPGIFVGADLMVSVFTLSLSTIALWIYYFKYIRILDEKYYLGWQAMYLVLCNLFRKSWTYWLLAIIVFFYSTFQIPLIAFFLGNHDAGIYRSAFILAAGVELLFNSLTSLLLPKLTVWSNLGLPYLWQKQKNLLKLFLMIGLPAILFLIISSEFIYITFLGDKFLEGIIIFQILLVGRLVVFLGQIYAWGLAATHQDTKFLYASILGAVISVILSIIFVPQQGIIAAAIISVLSEIIVHYSCFLFMRSCLSESSNDATR